MEMKSETGTRLHAEINLDECDMDASNPGPELDPETDGLLIQMVKEHPYLYDKSTSQFKDIKLKDKTWSDIGRTVGLSGAPRRLPPPIRATYGFVLQAPTPSAGSGSCARNTCAKRST